MIFEGQCFYGIVFSHVVFPAVKRIRTKTCWCSLNTWFGQHGFLKDETDMKLTVHVLSPSHSQPLHGGDISGAYSNRMSETALVIWNYTHFVLHWSEYTDKVLSSVDGFCWKLASYEIFSFLSVLEECKLFPTILSEGSAVGAPKVYSYVHSHSHIHRPVESKLCITVSTPFLVSLCFFFFFLERTQLRKLVWKVILFHRWHSPLRTFTHLQTGKFFSRSFVRLTKEVMFQNIVPQKCL